MAQQTVTRIIDTHIHVLQPSRWHYHWLEANSPLHSDFLLPTIEADLLACGVDGGVLMEATNTPQEIDWLLDMCHASPLQMGVIGWIAPDDPQGHEKMALFAKNPRFKGIRLNWLDSPPNMTMLAPILRACGAYGLVVDVLTTPKNLLAMAIMIKNYPHITFILDHMGGLELTHITPAIWRTSLEPLANLPNVVGKLSGFSTIPVADMTPTLHRLIEVGLDVFGSDRLMFGSNIPFGLNQISYGDIITHFRDAIQHLPHATQADLCHQTAERVYRLGEN
ncbi:MAG: amidohydrolase family protein [bacterium]|nr:amidohydrolase family protein [bacterium]